MPRSTRHKSSKHKDARDYSDSEKESSLKERKSSKDESIARVSKDSASGDKRKLDSSKEYYDSVNGEYYEEYTSSSKRRKGKTGESVNDKWNGKDEEKGESSKKTKASSEKSSRRREEGDGVETKKSSGKSDSKHRGREIKELDKDKEREKDEFNIEISQWSRKDVEGSLFVVKRNKQQPRFQFIVMNRRNTDNLVEDLLGDFEYEVQGPYLLYRNASQEVNGIWFYNKRECEEVARLFDRLLNAYSKANQKPNTSSSKSEFQELEAVPTMAVMDGPLEPSSTARDAPNDPAFVNFFSSAMALGNTSSGPASEPPYQSSATPVQPHQPTIAPPATAAPPQISPPPLQSSSPLMPLFDNNPDLISSNSNVHTDLVTPASFFGPPRMMAQPHLIPGSSMPPMPPLNLNNAAHQQRPYGTPMLQPFPPPTPPPSLAPAHSGPVINRDKVKEALLALVQENEFIDMVTRALQNAHQP